MSLAVTGGRLDGEVVGLRVEGGSIVALGPGVDSRPGDQVIDARGMALVPGLVNGHTHAAMTLFRGHGSDGLNNEHALVQLSGDGGAGWTAPAAVEEPGDRPDFAFLGISPNGSDLYVSYDGFLDPFRNDTTSDRRFVGVLRHADVSGTSLSNVTTLDRGSEGDGRASSANSLIDEFIGDYNTVDATKGGAVSVFNDASNAEVCEKMNAFRQATVGGTAGAPPAPPADCPDTFGNTDIFAAVAADPSP